MRKLLLILFFGILLFALLFKSPFSAMYNFNKAKTLCDAGNCEQALSYFERALFAQPKDTYMRYRYVLALSKVKPTYTVQKKLYTIATSEPQDEAAKIARQKAIGLRYSLLSEFSNNYVRNAVYGNDIMRWDIKSFPLKVYIENSSDIPMYYVEQINRALKVWTSRTNFIKFTEVSDQTQADVVITFKDIPSDVCSGNICSYTVAYTEPEITGKKVLKRMVLTFYKTNPKQKHFTSSEVYNTALHELGHTLGIMGHSNNPADLMYAEKENGQVSFPSLTSQTLTRRDINTLVLLYRIEPTITNTPNLKSETFYYAPLILGEDDERIQNKIVEFTNYVRKYPTISSGYINLASAYADSGNFEKALTVLSQGEAYARNNDEKFLTEYNKAVIYFNQQKYSTALEYANRAKSIKNDTAVDELISEIEMMSK